MFLFALAAVVGMLDYGTPVAPKGVTVKVITQNEFTDGYQHGTKVIRQMARTIGDEQVTVIYANPFLSDKANGGGNFILTDWTVAKASLKAMKKAGATHVCTTFTTNDEQNAREFKAAADALGLTIIASLGNGELDAPYPAMLPGVVAVLANEEVNKVHPAVKRRADYILPGKMDKDVVGSSIASARMCGKIATGR